MGLGCPSVPITRLRVTAVPPSTHTRTANNLPTIPPELLKQPAEELADRGVRREVADRHKSNDYDGHQKEKHPHMTIFLPRADRPVLSLHLANSAQGFMAPQ